MRSGPAASRPATARAGREPAPDHVTRSAPTCYVYGITSADLRLRAGIRGVGDSGAQVSMVRHGEVAALVSEIGQEWSLGSPRDLTMHKEVLDSLVTSVPVLPLRFGSVMPGQAAVARDLLAPNHDMFATALGELDGRCQYVVKGRYREDAIIREVLAEDREAARLRDRISRRGQAAPVSARIRLGEIISRAIEAKRHADSGAAAGRLGDVCEAVVQREPRHERDALSLAVLVRHASFDRMQRLIDELAGYWRERVDLRLLGPMAAYDFVATTAPLAV